MSILYQLARHVNKGPTYPQYNHSKIECVFPCVEAKLLSPTQQSEGYPPNSRYDRNSSAPTYELTSPARLQSTHDGYLCSGLGTAQAYARWRYQRDSRNKCLKHTYVRPVERFTPARRALIRSASKPRCTSFPNMVAKDWGSFRWTRAAVIERHMHRMLRYKANAMSKIYKKSPGQA